MRGDEPPKKKTNPGGGTHATLRVAAFYGAASVAESTTESAGPARGEGDRLGAGLIRTVTTRCARLRLRLHVGSAVGRWAAGRAHGQIGTLYLIYFSFDLFLSLIFFETVSFEFCPQRVNVFLFIRTQPTHFTLTPHANTYVRIYTHANKRLGDVPSSARETRNTTEHTRMYIP